MRSQSFCRNANYDGRAPIEVKRNTTLSRALAAEKRQSKSRPGHLGDSSSDMSPQHSHVVDHVVAPQGATPPTAVGPSLASASPAGRAQLASPTPGLPPHASSGSMASTTAGGPTPGASPAARSTSRKNPQRGPLQRDEQLAPGAGRVSWVDTRQQPEDPKSSGALGRSTSGAAVGAGAGGGAADGALGRSASSASLGRSHQHAGEDRRPLQRGGNRRSPRGEAQHRPDAPPRSFVVPGHAQAGPVGSRHREAPSGAPLQLAHGHSQPGHGGSQYPEEYHSAPLQSARGHYRVKEQASKQLWELRGRHWRAGMVAHSPRPPSVHDSMHLSRDSPRACFLPVRDGDRAAEFGGVGARLDPKKWTGEWKERQKEDPEKAQFDLELLDMLNHRAASAMSSPRGVLPTTPRPMSTAFTDRCLRKREGLGSRGVLVKDDAPFAGAASEGHGNCSCPVCKPFNLTPAGQASCSVKGNLLHPVHRGVPFASPHTTPRGTPGEGSSERARASPNYNSSHMQQVFHPSSERQADGPDEGAFQRQLGRKTKQSIVRSLSADSKDTAGRYNAKKFCMDLETPHDQRPRILGVTPEMKTALRDDVAMITMPRTNDPPVPMKITPCRKGDGENKYKLSKQSEQLSLHWNQPLYRYEIAARDRGQFAPARSASLPPERFGRLAGPWDPPAAEEPGSDGAGGRAGGIRRRHQLHESLAMAQVTNHEVVAQEVAQERRE
eukprot:CAMPEP_0179088344 /NCGR_PEP_ID=MMETSP0796-20121207/40192_1 /TAXON_ID=73915 /ORGANISM="Pyrodinium bahamense, Strain pbaha01" /LENGTH=722 /DNA_ID=CAMNT_0020785873 /DNA_START=198 /DNA_END=2363 /DNA_ORIENTATION=-